MKFVNSIKEKVNSTQAKMAVGATAALAAVAPGYCTADSQIQKVVNIVFGLIKFGGFVMLGVGIVQLVKTIVDIVGGDQAQPNALPKALAMLAAGIVAASAQAVLKAMGVDVSNISIFGS